MSREAEIDAFLGRVWKPGAPWRPLAADASFRRYFRVDGDPPTVLMDAPPDKEDVRPFMAIGEYLVENGFSAPRLIAADIAVRLVPAAIELKIGVVTALIGVPFFLRMIFSERRILEGSAR